LFANPVPNVIKELKIKYKIKETDETIKVILKEDEDHVFPNFSDSLENSDSESSKEEEKFKWDVIPIGFTESKNILEKTSGKLRLAFSMNECRKFKVKIIESKGWIGNFYITNSHRSSTL
jgi:hypothetical protein